jgi:hypothetical protein
MAIKMTVFTDEIEAVADFLYREAMSVLKNKRV